MNIGKFSAKSYNMWWMNWLYPFNSSPLLIVFILANTLPTIKSNQHSYWTQQLIFFVSEISSIHLSIYTYIHTNRDIHTFTHAFLFQWLKWYVMLSVSLFLSFLYWNLWKINTDTKESLIRIEQLSPKREFAPFESFLSLSLQHFWK